MPIFPKVAVDLRFLFVNNTGRVLVTNAHFEVILADTGIALPEYDPNADTQCFQFVDQSSGGTTPVYRLLSEIDLKLLRKSFCFRKEFDIVDHRPEMGIGLWGWSKGYAEKDIPG